MERPTQTLSNSFTDTRPSNKENPKSEKSKNPDSALCIFPTDFAKSQVQTVQFFLDIYTKL